MTQKYCEHEDLVYTSLPAQYKCKNCGQFWICGHPVPICHTQSKCKHHWESKGAFMKVCRKCGEIVKGIHDGVHKSTTQPWQERFDNTFGIYWSKNSNGTFGMFDEYPSKVIILNGDGIKKFIQQELDRQRQEIREKIDNMEVNKPNSISEEMLYEIKKTALKECKRIILKDILENI